MRIKGIAWGVALLLGAALYVANAYCTVEGAVRKDKKVKLSNNIVRRLLTFSDYANAIDRVCVLLDIGCLCLIGYWFAITCSGRYELQMSYFYVGVIYMAIDLLGMAYIEICRIKERKEQVYRRENYDIKEIENKICVNQNSYRTVYSISKRNSEVKATIIFWPSSFYLFQDIDGFGYGMVRTNKFEKLTNIGAYEELSDYLVHNGYATLRVELERENGVNPYIVQELGAQIQALLDEQEHGDTYFVLLHGPSNRLLSEISQSMKLSGIISLCGAAMSCEAQLAQLEQWNSRKQMSRIKMQVINENPMLFTEEMQRKTTEELIAELFAIADKMPVFLGYAEQDPYYGFDNVDKIDKQKHRNVSKHYFNGTDFTLRRCNQNKKIHYDGYTVESVFTKRLHLDVAEKICDWISSCDEM